LGGRFGSSNYSAKGYASRNTFEWGRSRFLQEAQSLARFRHSNIVRVTRVFEAFSTTYLYGDGIGARFDFDPWVRALRRTPTQEELDRIAALLLDALE